MMGTFCKDCILLELDHHSKICGKFPNAMSKLITCIWLVTMMPTSIACTAISCWQGVQSLLTSDHQNGWATILSVNVISQFDDNRKSGLVPIPGRSITGRVKHMLAVRDSIDSWLPGIYTIHFICWNVGLVLGEQSSKHKCYFCLTLYCNSPSMLWVWLYMHWYWELS